MKTTQDSAVQVTTTVTLLIGLTALTIPRIAAAEAGVDGTFAVLLAGLIANISAIAGYYVYVSNLLLYNFADL